MCGVSFLKSEVLTQIIHVAAENKRAESYIEHIENLDFIARYEVQKSQSYCSPKPPGQSKWKSATCAKLQSELEGDAF